MTMPEQCRLISLDKIDENVITKVRDLNEQSETFKILENSIKEDSQRHPIILRLLNEDEKRLSKSGTIYGIIDGHHRYHIALRINRKEILANVIPNNEEFGNSLSDVKLALRLNESSIKMTNDEKGKIIYDVMRKTGMDIQTIALELFGVKISMAYRYLNAYKKSIGEKVISKPKKQSEFRMKDLKVAWRPISKIKEIPLNVDDCISCLEDIQNFEKELRKCKQTLLAQEGVTDKINKRKSIEQR